LNEIFIITNFQYYSDNISPLEFSKLKKLPKSVENDAKINEKKIKTFFIRKENPFLKIINIPFLILNSITKLFLCILNEDPIFSNIDVGLLIIDSFLVV
jgi:hypothetical protein